MYNNNNIIMLDIFSIPDGDIIEYKEYKNGCSGNQWLEWVKPRGTTLTYILGIGAGGGGGGGQTRALAASGGGGGGGGSGGIVRVAIPTIFLPDILFIQVGLGGARGNAGASGTAGGITYVSTVPSASGSDFLLLKSSNATAGGGGGGSAGTGGTGGAAATVATNTQAMLATAGIWSAIAGVAGVNGGNATSGTNITLLQTKPIHGGCGGAGTNTSNTNFSGGLITTAGIIPPIGTASGGYNNFKPFYSTPGCGGDSNGTSTANEGFPGGIGSGGGGGGSGVTGAPGGRGGNGYVLIISI